MATHVEKRSVTDVLADEQEPEPEKHIEKRSVTDVLADERARTPEKPARTEGPPGPNASFFTKAKKFLKQLFSDALDDNIDSVGAMMAYYAVLAIFPMLVFIVTIAMLVLDDSTVQQGVAMATSTMPYATRQLVATKVQEFMDTAGAGFAVGGAAFALWGASRGAVALSMALNSVFSKQETRPWWKRQLIAIAVTVAVAFMIVAALALLVLGPLAGHFVADRIGMGAAFDVVWGVGRWLGAGVLVMIVWAILYKYLPNTDAPFRIFTPGAVVGVVLWLGISLLFGVYLDYFNSYEATYGALGAGIIFLTWLWLSNIAILFGAEINDVLADFRKHADAASAKLADPDEPAATKI